MQRRKFITHLGGAAFASSVFWPLAARAQPAGPIRRIGVLMHLPAGDLEGQDRFTAFLKALLQLGWANGRNVRIDIRWGATDADRRRYAAELIEFDPDVILASTTLATMVLLRATRTVPVVFVNVADPVGAGFVESMARPGRNATGFTTFDLGFSAKWLERLKEIAPRVTRAAVIWSSAHPAGIGQFEVIQSVAPSLGVEVSRVIAGESGEIERSVSAFARSPNGGLIVTGSAFGANESNLMVTLAARHRLPAIYPFRFFATGGGLISYGPDTIDPYRRAASYVDRILKGEKAADLPVQGPTKYEMVINLKTAKALGLTIPESVLLQATELIE